MDRMHNIVGVIPQAARRSPCKATGSIVLAGMLLMLSGCASLRFFSPGESAPTDYAPMGPTAFRLEVPASAQWMRTELSLQEGQGVELLAGGQVRLSQDPQYNQWVGPWGFETPCTVNEGNPCALDAAPYGGLLARIGDGEPFYLGGEKFFNSPRSGYLYLATNDNLGMYTDNTGSFLVLISIGEGLGEETAQEPAILAEMKRRGLAGPF
jgi:hypothetical protein